MDIRGAERGCVRVVHDREYGVHFYRSIRKILRTLQHVRVTEFSKCPSRKWYRFSADLPRLNANVYRSPTCQIVDIGDHSRQNDCTWISEERNEGALVLYTTENTVYTSTGAFVKFWELSNMSESQNSANAQVENDNESVPIYLDWTPMSTDLQHVRL